MFKNKVYLSIGSNIGDRESNIASSIAMLGSFIEISKIRGETSYGMLCSEAELNLSNESEGIIELTQNYKKKI